MLEPLDELVGENWLGFAGIGPIVAPALSKEQHWAEKVHAYTLPRSGTANSRVRDLVDLALLIERGSLSLDRICLAVEATFVRRATHGVPDALPAPPKTWARAFAALAAECRLEDSLDDAYERLRRFWRGVRTR